MKNFCRDCENRHPACWGSCEKYIVAKAEHEKQKKARHDDFKRNDMLDSIYFTGQKYERNRR